MASRWTRANGYGVESGAHAALYTLHMNNPIPSRHLLSALLLSTASLCVTGRSDAQEPAVEAPAQAAPPSAETVAKVDAGDKSDRVGLEEIRRFVSVYRAVKQAYVDPVADVDLMSAAIRGLLADLDPHSAYLDKEASAALNEMAEGEYGGLGLEIIQRPDRSLTVIAPIDDTPAARAGIQPGDVITAMDGELITADSVDAAIEAMRGEPGTSITLTIVREGESAPLEVQLIREIIRVNSVRVEVLSKDYLYLRIATFQADTGMEVSKRLEAAVARRGSAFKGLVLDLRSNPGGLLNAAVDVADQFLERGLIVSTRGRLPYATNEFEAHRGDVLDGAPIVLLIDAGSASASEVLAGALRDHKRAVIMGTRSFGKGSVQTVLPLDNGDSIKLTTARYYTPSGTSIQATGIVPDIELLENASLKTEEVQGPTIREANLPGHLRAETLPVEADDKATLADDYAVGEALNLLRGLAVFRDRD